MPAGVTVTSKKVLGTYIRPGLSLFAGAHKILVSKSPTPFYPTLGRRISFDNFPPKKGTLLNKLSTWKTTHIANIKIGSVLKR